MRKVSAYPMEEEIKITLKEYSDKSGLKQYRVIELALKEFFNKHNKEVKK